MWRPTSTACSSIAAVLDRDAGDYLATLDGNEQYDSVEGIAELWRRMRETPALARLVEATLFIEQPIKRAKALATSVEPLARLKPLIIDESDGELASFPAALKLGYSGVSSKNCKGLYKSILNAARVAKLNAEAGAQRYFMSAEDLTTLAGVSVQQDLALVSLLGLTPRGAQRPPLHRRHVVRARARAGGLRRRASRSLRAAPAVRRACASTTAGSQLGSLGLPGLCRRRRHGLRGHAADAGAAGRAASRPPTPRRPHERRAPAGAVRERRRARGFHDRADAGAGRRSRARAGRHPGPRRRRQDGADAGAHGQARGAGQARRRRRALLRSGSARRPGSGGRRDDRLRPARPARRCPRCRSSTTSSTWRP